MRLIWSFRSGPLRNLLYILLSELLFLFLLHVALISSIEILIFFLLSFIHLVWMLVVLLDVQLSFQAGHDLGLFPPMQLILAVVNKGCGWCQKIGRPFAAYREDSLFHDGFRYLNGRSVRRLCLLSSLMVWVILYRDALRLRKLRRRPRLPESLPLINTTNCCLKLSRSSILSFYASCTRYRLKVLQDLLVMPRVQLYYTDSRRLSPLIYSLLCGISVVVFKVDVLDLICVDLVLRRHAYQLLQRWQSGCLNLFCREVGPLTLRQLLIGLIDCLFLAQISDIVYR